jgi:hypothetical protein
VNVPCPAPTPVDDFADHGVQPAHDPLARAGRRPDRVTHRAPHHKAFLGSLGDIPRVRHDGPQLPAAVSLSSAASPAQHPSFPL